MYSAVLSKFDVIVYKSKEFNSVHTMWPMTDSFKLENFDI